MNEANVNRVLNKLSACSSSTGAYCLAQQRLPLKKKVLVTTNHKELPKKALGQSFLQRWHVEVDLRNIKTTLGMDVLSCKMAKMCEKEMWVYVLAYNLIRLLMAEAADRFGTLPRTLSFKHTLQLLVT